MPTTPPSITALPAPPDPNDRATFNTRAYPWSVAQQTLATEVGAVATNVFDNATEANANALATADDRVQTGLDRTQTGLDRANLASLDELWLGSAASDPATGKAGAPLVAGNAYVNSSTGLLRAYNGTAWVAGISTVAGVESLNGSTGALTLKTINSTSLLGAGDIAVLSSITRSARTSNTMLAAADIGKLIDITSGTFTQTFDAAATLGDGWWCYLRNSGTGVVTLDPNAAETIDGVATKALDPGQAVIVQCDGTALRTVALEGVGNHFVTVHTGNGFGSTNNKIRRYTTTLGSSGTAITYADSDTLGATFTINETGVYAVQTNDVVASGAGAIGISLNSAQLTTSIASASVASVVTMMSCGSGVIVMSASSVVRLAAGDVIRPHTDGTQTNVTDRVYFTIRKVDI